MSVTISITDLPVENHEKDLLNTKDYAQTLARFITRCETPLTIGVQGEWGSGKTSLLNMVKQYLKDETVDHREDEKNARTKTIPGEEYFECVWINTWEHSLLKSSEECLFSIIEEIIDQVAVRAGTWTAAKKAKSALSTLLRGTARIGASITMGAHAGQVADEMLSSSKVNGVAELRASLRSVVNEVRENEKNPCYRFVIFVDDLDRLEPPVAVQILELLKNIFTIDHCVFVLAIDYQVVVKGLKEKFGDPNESNEWEFRAFFDKIIQVPFMMPMAQYKLDDYVLQQLTDTIPYFSSKKGDNEADDLKDGRLGSVAQLTIGNNPRAIKRLLNSVSLINLQNETKIPTNPQKFELKQLIFTLVCIQIAYPKTYELLLREPDFRTWNLDFFEKISSSKRYRPNELDMAFQGIRKVNESDFDDDWEEALFKIIWVMEWQRARVVDISRVLSVIDEKILSAIIDSKDALSLLTDALKMTAVTSIASTEDSIFTKDQSDTEQDDSENKKKYWQKLRKAIDGKNCSFNQKKISSTYKNPSLSCAMAQVRGVAAVACINSKTPLKFEASRPEDWDEYKRLMIAIDRNKSELEAKVHVKCRIHNLAAPAGKQYLGFDSPSSVTKQVSPAKDEKIGDDIIDWIQAHIEEIEQFIVEMDKKKDDLETYVSSPTPQ